MCTICYNTDGTVAWSHIYDGGYDFDNSEGLTVDSENNVFVIGYSFTSETASNEVIFKYSPDGDSLWSYINNESGMEEGARGVAIDSEDNIYVTGYRQQGSVQYPDDYLTQKFSGNDGALLWEFTFDRDSATDEANTICIYDIDDIFVSGRSHTWDSWYDIATVNYTDTLQTTVADNNSAIMQYSINNFPNPFINQTTITYSVPEYASNCVIDIFNIQGQNIKTFNFNNISPGNYSVTWNINETDGISVSPGIYFCKYRIDGNIADSHKIVIAE
jgi:hypothetical protein